MLYSQEETSLVVDSEDEKQQHSLRDSCEEKSSKSKGKSTSKKAVASRKKVTPSVTEDDEEQCIVPVSTAAAIPKKRRISKEDRMKVMLMGQSRHQQDAALQQAIATKCQLLSGTFSGLCISSSLCAFLMRELRQTVASPMILELVPEHKFLLFGEIPLDMDYFVNRLEIRQTESSMRSDSTSNRLMSERFRPIKRCVSSPSRMEFELESTHRGLRDFQFIINALLSMRSQSAQEFACNLQDYQAVVNHTVQQALHSSHGQPSRESRTQESYRQAHAILNSLAGETEVFIYNITSKDSEGIATLRKGFSKGLIRSLNVSESEFESAVRSNKLFSNIVEDVNQLNVVYASIKMAENPYARLCEHEVRKNIHPDIADHHSQQFQNILPTLLKEAVAKKEALIDFVSTTHGKCCGQPDCKKVHNRLTQARDLSENHLPNPLPTFGQYQRFIKHVNLHPQRLKLNVQKQLELFENITQVLTKKNINNNCSSNPFPALQLPSPRNDSQNKFLTTQSRDSHDILPLEFFPPLHSQQIEKEDSVEFFPFEKGLNYMRQFDQSLPDLPSYFNERHFLQDRSFYCIPSNIIHEESSYLPDEFKPFSENKQNSSQSMFLPPTQTSRSSNKIKDFYEQLLQYIGNEDEDEGQFPFPHINSTFKQDIIHEYEEIRTLLEDGDLLPHGRFVALINEIKSQPKIKKKQYLKHLMKIPDYEDYAKKERKKKEEKSRRARAPSPITGAFSPAEMIEEQSHTGIEKESSYQESSKQSSEHKRQDEVIKKVYNLSNGASTGEYLEVFYIGKTKLWKEFQKDFILNHEFRSAEKQLNAISKNKLVMKFYPEQLPKQSSNPAEPSSSPVTTSTTVTIKPGDTTMRIERDLLDKIIKQFKMGPPHPFKVLLTLKKSLQKIVQHLPETIISQPLLKDALKMVVFHAQGDIQNYIECRRRLPLSAIADIDKKVIKKISLVPLI